MSALLYRLPRPGGVAAGLCLAAVLTCGLASGTASSNGRATAAERKLPLYEFLIKSGVSKRARPEAAILSGVVTVLRDGQQVVTSTTRLIYRRHLPELLDAIQTAIINGTVVETDAESSKVGTLQLSYSDGSTFTVIIYNDFYEITTAAGTIRFTSVPLTEILRKQLE
ncbi:MAG: hypothetical protein JW889_10295 [Verrucomicrobia bacterium]|nr:hypothetical protein [Verrucomicrobiota bacterium]